MLQICAAHAEIVVWPTHLGNTLVDLRFMLLNEVFVDVKFVFFDLFGITSAGQRDGGAAAGCVAALIGGQGLVAVGVALWGSEPVDCLTADEKTLFVWLHFVVR